MKFWWVNHKQTAQQELTGGYIWSPKREANGNFSQFYSNMRSVSPGDRIVSYANGQISHAGIIQDFAAHAPNPFSASGVGRNWSNDGWLVPVDWERLATAVMPKAILDELRPLLPSRYSPIRPLDGNGNQKAYLAEISDTAYALVVGTQGRVPFAKAAKVDAIIENAELEIQGLLSADSDISATERHQVVLARRGQGLFRQRVIQLEPTCRLTGVSTPHLLIASHIKPWRSCSDSKERLDGANGLMLTPHADWLFDRGLISFTDSGALLISPLMQTMDISALHLEVANERQRGFSSAQAAYLDFHRSRIFLQNDLK